MLQLWRMRVYMPIISDLSKLEGRLMSHFEATLMLTTNNHFNKNTFQSDLWFYWAKNT